MFWLFTVGALLTFVGTVTVTPLVALVGLGLWWLALRTIEEE